jgi:hypothetical protein
MGRYRFHLLGGVALLAFGVAVVLFSFGWPP